MLLYFLCIVIPLNAQWVKTNGPCGRGGEINSICISGSDIIAGTDNGVYVSKDNGMSWLNINPQVTAGRTVPYIRHRSFRRGAISLCKLGSKRRLYIIG